jgi:ribonuclease J
MDMFDAGRAPWTRDELLFVPLGGAGEIGMNLNLYGYGGKWVMVDLGVTFGAASPPGIEVVMPDPAFAEALGRDLLGIVLTHAHEDHLGAIQYLWPRLRCPVWASPFTAALLKRKLADNGLGAKVPITVVDLGSRFDIGPFGFEMVTLTHSIPEPSALAITTPVGTVMHTGDWKFDPDPLIGSVSDEVALRRIGKGGVLALVGDSTNAFVDGVAGSESEVRASLIELVSRFPGRRVAVTCFASNVARLESIAEAAAANGRRVALVGRSLHRIVEAAREVGYLRDIDFVDADDIGYLPRGEALVICTGSQGEPRAALARIAADSHPDLSLEEGDVVVFSSRVIPGNEVAIGQLQDRLIRQGLQILTDRDALVHVSGHPAREELARMYALVRPRIAVPVHGELRHMAEHARLARACQVPHAVLAENGAVLRLGPGEPIVLDRVTAGRLGLDGHRLVKLEDDFVKDRQRVAENGAAVATLTYDVQGRLVGDPQVTLVGLDRTATVPILVDGLRDAFAGASRVERQDPALLRESLEKTFRKLLRQLCGSRPATVVHVTRVDVRT